MNENIEKSKKGIILKIIIPVLIIIAIAGIWIVKNRNKNEIAGTDKSGTVVTDNPDFELHVTENIDLEKLTSYGIPIVIDFGADSCIPCKEMAPVLKELNTELQGKAIIKFVDVWKYQQLAQGYPISLIPTQIFIDAEGNPYTPKDPQAMQMKMYTSRDNGEHIFTAHEGGMTKDQILRVLKEMGLE